MAAAVIDLETGTAPAIPASNHVRVYAKTDKKVYAQTDTGAESALIGQNPDGAIVESDGTVDIASPGISGVVHTGTGEYAVTLATPITFSTIKIPLANIKDPGFVTTDYAGPPPTSQINVKTYNTAGSPADMGFSVVLIPIAL